MSFNCKHNELTKTEIGDFSIKNSGSEKLLGVNIDSKLNFDYQVTRFCSKVNKKLRTLAQVAPRDLSKQY